MGGKSSVSFGECSFEELLKEARAGSRLALGHLLQGIRKYLLYIGDVEIDGNLQSKGTGSDLVQDTFLEAQQAFREFRGHSRRELQGWLRRIFVHNLANFRRRYHEIKKRHVGREVSMDDHRLGSRIRASLSARHSSPLEEVVQSEQSKMLRVVLQQLPESYRQVVFLHAAQGMSFPSIGERIGCSGEAARKTWTRALKCIGKGLSGLE
jgi:RNA polymerase sigma-70 factor, ECF subfamily